MIKVFIENEAGSNQKNIFNEKTLEHKKTYTVSRKYPFPYGFILDTTSGDGDNVDCFILTSKKLKTGQLVECEPICLMEQLENGEVDHNVLARVVGEELLVDENYQKKLTEFISHVFDHQPDKVVKVGNFLEQKDALDFIHQHLDSSEMEGSVG